VGGPLLVGGLGPGAPRPPPKSGPDFIIFMPVLRHFKPGMIKPI